MSYQVLARKYRPRSFDTLVGQEHVVRALTHALEQKRLHHAWLFTGTRGVGKTTLSRILAKSLNCQGPDGKGEVTAQPCGQCEACVAIDAGRFVDYIEMDAASNRGVDEMAQLLEQAVYAPSNARYKVYMIDEVHMLSNHAFNAMLKTLEEPPEHVKFILATTDPQKIPVTVLSRCLQFNLKQMPPGHIVGHLENILGQESIEFEAPALRLLAQGAHGSMRDALSLTDQAIAYSAGKVTLEAVQGMLGALDQSYLIRLLDSLVAGDGTGLLAVADEMAARSLSYQAALQDLGSLLHRIAMAQTVPAALPSDLPEREHILHLAGQLQPDEVQLYYQIVVHGRNELGLAPDEYAGFTMTLLRLLAFKPSDAPAAPAPSGGRVTGSPAPAMSTAGVASAAAAPPVALPVASQDNMSRPVSAPPQTTAAQPPSGRGAMSPARAALEAARGGVRAASSARSMPRPSAPPEAPAQTAAPAAAPVRPLPASPPPPWESDDGEPDLPPGPLDADMTPPEPLQSAEAPSAPQLQARARASAPPLPAEPVPIPGTGQDWPALAATLPLRGVVQQLALQSELIRCEGGEGALTLCLRIPVETLRSAGSPEKLEAALTEQLGRKVNVQTEVGPVSHTASALATAEREQRQREAEHTMQNDPFVQTLMREFGASIVPGSVRPN